MIELFQDKSTCCGCHACCNICPKNAITMQVDPEGFKYPVIDSDKCIDCKLCEKVCTFNKNTDISKNTQQYYAAKHIVNDIRSTSTSGGVFTAVSDLVLKQNGVVYGAKFDKDLSVVHSRAETSVQRDEFKGSKYVQSNMNDVFEQVIDDLNNKKTVLFTGTPCQCDAIKSYLNIKKADQSKLILCDFVCHGTPSPLIFKEHLSALEKLHGSKVKNYYFRSKINGWNRHTEMCVLENGKTDHSSHISQTYKRIFHSCTALRPSCHNCQYASLSRVSDMTFADCWGINKTAPEFDDNKGVSLIIINSTKGQAVFEAIKQNLNLFKIDINDVLQPQLQYPIKPSPEREQFWKNYHNKGYSYLIKYYNNVSCTTAIRNFMKVILIKAGIFESIKKALKK